MVRLALTALAALALLSPGALARGLDARTLLTLREIGGFQSGHVLSPDLSHVAVFERTALIEQDAYRFELVVVDLGSGQTALLAEAGGAILRSSTGRYNGAIDDRIPIWSPDSAWIAYLAAHEGGVELWRIRRDGAQSQRLVADGRDVLAAAYLNADEIVFRSARASAEIAGEAAREARLGFRVDDRLEPYYSLRPYPDLSLGQNVRVLRLADGALRDATSAEAAALLASAPDAPPDAVAYHTSAGEAVTLAPRVSGDRALRPALALALSRGRERLKSCGRAECQGRLTAAWIVGSGQVLFQRNEGHNWALTALYRWDANTDAIRRVRLDDELLLGCQMATRALICLQESPAQPRRLIAVDITNGRARVLRDPNPHWDRLALSRIERLEGVDRYGNQGHAHLVWPHNHVASRRYPLVIVQYRSRGFLRGGVGNEYPIHALAARGYFVLSVERTEWADLSRRLSAAELQLRTELDGSELAMKQSQLEALLDQIEQRGLIDPSRIGITGLSDGAETAWLMLTHSNRIAAAAISTPPTDPIAWSLISERFRAAQRAEGVQGPGPGASDLWASWWDRNSTIRHAEAIDAPVLMQYADNEALLGFPLAARLNELGTPFELYLYPGEYHVKWRPMHILMAQQRALDWFDFWLRDIERSDPEDPDRLPRWRALRARQAANGS